MNHPSKSTKHLFTPAAPSRASRQFQLGSKGSHTGTLVGGATPTRILFESSLEHRTALMLLRRCDVVDLLEQPRKISFVDEAGNRHDHTFDYLVRLSDGRRVAIAVKPRHRALRLKLEAQLILMARQIPKSFATHVMLVTEDKLPRDLVRDAELIYSARRERPGSVDEAVRHAAARLIGEVTIAALVETTNAGPQGFRAIVRLIAAGDLKMTSTGPISHASRVARSSLPARPSGLPAVA